MVSRNKRNISEAYFYILLQLYFPQKCEIIAVLYYSPSHRICWIMSFTKLGNTQNLQKAAAGFKRSHNTTK